MNGLGIISWDPGSECECKFVSDLNGSGVLIAYYIKGWMENSKISVIWFVCLILFIE